jgi:hypothetical protein
MHSWDLLKKLLDSKWNENLNHQNLNEREKDSSYHTKTYVIAVALKVFCETALSEKC